MADSAHTLSIASKTVFAKDWVRGGPHFDSVMMQCSRARIMHQGVNGGLVLGKHASCQAVHVVIGRCSHLQLQPAVQVQLQSQYCSCCWRLQPPENTTINPGRAHRACMSQAGCTRACSSVSGVLAALHCSLNSCGSCCAAAGLSAAMDSAVYAVLNPSTGKHRH
jgi:hypothetical protein